jgi:hypothetical protein
MSPARPTPVPVLLGGWFVLAFVAGATGRVARLEPPAPQLVLLGLTLLALGLVTWNRSIRDWVEALDTRSIVAFHVLRLVAGLAFLIMYMRGLLPGAFAVPAGWGDVIVAVLAAMLLLMRLPVSNGRAYAAWNLLGFADIIFVVFTAARLGLANPASMGALLQLPLSLLPTFLVPLIIVSHIVLLRRLGLPRAITP